MKYRVHKIEHNYNQIWHGIKANKYIVSNYNFTTSNPNQATQYLQIGGDTLNPSQITQHPQMGGDTSNYKILILMT